MRVACAVPWRPGQPDRERHHAIVKAHLRSILPDAHHVDVDTGHEAFCLAGCRNQGVRAAEEAACDVVVLCDADTLPEKEPLLEAVEGAADGRLHLPYRLFKGFSPKGTAAFLSGTPAHQCEVELQTEWSTGGIMVIQPDAWWRMGGSDERFRGWGFEDTAARVAADALLGPTVRHDGTIYHLWHPTARNPASPLFKANEALMRRYAEAEGNPDAVRAIVAEFAPWGVDA